MAKYVLLSVPSTIDSLKATIANNGKVVPFTVPKFKIGTLDALVQQADDLARLDAACEALVVKVGDSLRSLYDGDEARAAEQKTVNDSTDARRESLIFSVDLLTRCNRTDRSVPPLLFLEHSSLQGR
jgi:hypothetical protein